MLVIPDFYKGSFGLNSKFVDDFKNNELTIYNVKTEQVMVLKKEELETKRIKIHPTVHNNYQFGNYQNYEYEFEENSRLDNWDKQKLKYFHWTWFNELEWIHKTEFLELNKVLNNDRKRIKVLPEKDKTYNAFSKSLWDIKVVIIGIDTYENNLSNGLLFANDNDTVTKSIANLDNFYNLPNSLVNWKNQGVLLLHTNFTAVENNYNYYTDKWILFVKDIIRVLNNRERQFILVGKQGQMYKDLIKSEFIYETGHPVRNEFDTSIFDKVNENLEQIFEKQIRW